jgi:ubiquinol oxidase
MASNGSPTPYQKPNCFSDHIALTVVKFMRFFADAFFSGRYGHRAVVLETIAGVPGMVGGALQHLRSLRRMKNDDGWIKTLLDEAENERMHLLTFVQIAKPSTLERWLVILAQGVFYTLFFLLYIVSTKTAHRLVGYLEEEAIYSYSEYLKDIEAGKYENIPAPTIAIEYWDLPEDAHLREVVIAVRDDEIKHRNVNHEFADKLSCG